LTRAGPAPDDRTAEAWLERLEHLFAHSNNMASEEWMLVATLLVQAAEATGWSEQRSSLHGERFQAVLAGFRDLTDGFTRPAFLGATRAARRKNPALFA
jgi:hypothetical protein